MHMRTTVNIDLDVLEEASRVLQTEGMSETVNAALREVIAATRRARLVQRIRGKSLPVPTPADLRRLRAQRIETGSLG